MSIKLHSKQIKAARMVAQGESFTDIARELKLCKNTLSRWKKIPEFNMEIERFMDEQHAMVRVQFTRMAQKSVSVLWWELNSDSEHSKRLQAALGVLKLFGLDRVAVPPGLITGNAAFAQAENEAALPAEAQEPPTQHPGISCRVL